MSDDPVSESTFDRMALDLSELRERVSELEAACEAVVGHGYIENNHPAGQDYVAKSAIAKVRAAIRKAKREEAKAKL